VGWGKFPEKMKKREAAEHGLGQKRKLASDQESCRGKSRLTSLR